MEPDAQKSFPSFDFEKEVERAKGFKEDLDKGGWTERFKVPGRFESWSKTFSEEEVSVKVLFMFRNMSLSAEKFAEMMHPQNMETRTRRRRSFPLA